MAMSLLFALALLAVYTGVAAIVGAFLAGLALAESTGPRERDLAHGVTELLVPFFLAGIGLHVGSLGVLAPEHGVAGDRDPGWRRWFRNSSAAAWAPAGLGKADALRIGVGMIPRGEVGMVVAQIGLGFGIISQNVLWRSGVHVCGHHDRGAAADQDCLQEPAVAGRTGWRRGRTPVLKNPGTVDPNPPHGERGNFRKISVSLPPWIYERLIRESARRKIDGERNQLISELIREAVNQYLDRLDSCTTNGDFESS